MSDRQRLAFLLMVVLGGPFQEVCSAAPGTGNGCSGVFYQLDRFSDSLHPELSREGNRWYAYSDASSDSAKRNDSARGSSNIVLPAGVTGWMPANGSAVVTAMLEKNVTGSTFAYHPYAGWAGIGVGFALPSADISINFSRMSAIQFDLVAGATWDTKNIPTLEYKVFTSSTPESAPYAAEIPLGTGLQTICVDMSDLTQPSWYNERTYGTKTGPAITTDALTKMAWEMRIRDQRDSGIHASGPNTFAISNVKLFGIDSGYVANARDDLSLRCLDTASNPGDCDFHCEYPGYPIFRIGIPTRAGVKLVGTDPRHGLVLNASVAKTSQVDVHRMDGTIVRSFTASQAASIRLDVGVYLVRIREAGRLPLVGRLVVVR